MQKLHFGENPQSCAGDAALSFGTVFLFEAALFLVSAVMASRVIGVQRIRLSDAPLVPGE